jgi:hypothetical protein
MKPFSMQFSRAFSYFTALRRTYIFQHPSLNTPSPVFVLPTVKNKSKRIPSIFKDESTESFICLMRHIYMSHVNKVQPIRVKMICIAAIRVRCMKDFVSVVKLLLKAFFFCSLFSYPPPPNPRSIRLIV